MHSNDVRAFAGYADTAAFPRLSNLWRRDLRHPDVRSSVNSPTAPRPIKGAFNRAFMMVCAAKPHAYILTIVENTWINKTILF